MPKMPKYNPRFLIENKSDTQIFGNTINPPPPMPCTALAPINIPILVEIAHNKLPIQKTTAAARIVGFRPKTSEILPQVATNDVLPSM
jgi:hypothetical protein